MLPAHRGEARRASGRRAARPLCPTLLLPSAQQDTHMHAHAHTRAYASTHSTRVCIHVHTYMCARTWKHNTCVLARHRHSVVLVPGRTDHACAGTHPLPNTLLFGSHALLGAGGDTVHRTDQAQVLGNTQPRRYKLLSSLMDLEHRHRSGQPSRYNTAGPQTGRGLPAPLPRVAPRPSEPGQHGAELHEVPSLDESGVPGPTTRRADQADTAVWTHGLRVVQASPRKTESGSNRNTSPPCGGSCTVLRHPPPPPPEGFQ